MIRLPISHYCRKVEWALAHAGMAYDARDVWFRELVSLHDLHPEGTVPVLATRDGRVCGSQAILQWIDAAAPRADLYPSPEVHAWEAWADLTLGPLARRDCYRTIYERPTGYTNNPLAWLLFRVARRQVLGILKHVKARRDYDRDDEMRHDVLARVASQIRSTGTGFLFTTAPTAADFATAAFLEPMMRLRRHSVSRHPDRRVLGAYVRRVRPSRLQRRRARRSRARLPGDERARLAALPIAVAENAE